MRTLLIAFLAVAAAACSGGGAPVASQAAPSAAGQVLVQLADPDDDDDVDDIRRRAGGLSMERIGQTSFFVLHLPGHMSVDEALADLDNDLRVVRSSPNYLSESPEGGPRDVPTLGSELFDEIAVQPGLDLLNLGAAHAVTRGAGIVVGIVDTGIDPTHPLFAGRIHPSGRDFIDQDADPTDERDFLDNDGDGLVDEQFGHGTFVASMVLAVAPDAMLLPVRSLNDEGIGTTSTVAAGIVWAVDNGAQVVNVSVDIPNAPEAVKEAIEYAKNREVVVVAAAGNDADNQVIFPARFSDALAVAAVDRAGIVAEFTNTGSMVSVVAPGVDLLGAFPVSENPAGTARWSGTSFATPLVAGSAALVLSVSPFFAPDEVVRRLEDTALSVDALNPAVAGRLGAGLVQPAAAVAP